MTEPKIELIEGDCLEVMPELPDGSIDMILTDLPYGTTANAWDAVIPFEPMWREFKRLCPTGAIVLHASQPFTSALVMSQPKAFKHEWVWEKNKASGHLNAKRRPMLAHESVLVFAFGRYAYTPQMTDGHEAGHAAVRRQPSSNYGAQKPSAYGGSTQRYPRSVQRFAVVNNDSPDRVHPTQKPLTLEQYLIRTYSNPGDTILSATAGSGTVLLAARNEGRNAIGIEREPKYFDAASARLWPEPAE